MRTRSIYRGIVLINTGLLLAGFATADELDDRLQQLEQRLTLAEQRAASAEQAATQQHDSDISLHVGGRIELDAATYRADNNDFGDGTRVRRLFLDVRGSAYTHWAYRFQYDFARPSGSDTSARGVRDAWIQYRGLPAVITAGNFRQPFGLEALTSGLNTTFIERGLTNVFAPDRHLGIAVSYDSPRWSGAFGVFGETAEGDVENEGDEGWDIATRITYSPINTASRLFHLGLSARYNSPEDSQTGLRFRERPESNITDVRLIDTGALTGVQHIGFTGFEAAGIWGPLSIQTEWIQADIKRHNSEKDVSFSAAYLYTSVLLSGESRRYKNGVFGRIKPSQPINAGGNGAWELGLRYSTADLSDGTVTGGEQNNLTLGLNWYATDTVRISANYITVLNVDRPGSTYHDEKLRNLLLRAQVDF